MVIIGHSFHVWPIYEFFYCVHMPLFFLVSGYFFSIKGGLGGVILKNVKQLILPYLAVSAIICILFLLFRQHGEIILRETLLGTTLQNEHNIVLGPVWFFLALFWCRLTYRFLAQRTNTTQRSLIILVITVGLTVINRYRPIYQIPWEVTEGMVGMFYYHIGAVLKSRNFVAIEQKTAHKTILVSISFIALLCIIIYYKLNGTNMNLSALKFPLFPIDMINAVLLVASLYIVVEWGVKRGWCGRLNEFLVWFGESSMVIYFIHCIEYHFTIPFMSSLTAESEVAAFRYLIIICNICNPIIQILLCMVGLYVYNKFKVRMVEHQIKWQ